MAVRRKASIIPVLLSSRVVGWRTSAERTLHRVGQVPPERLPPQVPGERVVARVPKGDPLSHVPVPHVARVPLPHPVAAPPNPRRPRLVRDVHGGTLLDLFELFPDLPRPSRPSGRLPIRRRIGRRW